jgi:hypothetical protein
MADQSITTAERQQVFGVCLERINECETLADLERVAGEIRELKDLSEIPDAEWHQVKQVWLFRKREVVDG